MNFEETINLVNSLQFQTISNQLKIIVVDNASPNESVNSLESFVKSYDNVIFLKSKSNLGYAGGNNLGLNYLDEFFKPDYVCILNNDILFDNDCFEKLLDIYQKLEEPAFICPMQMDNSGNILPPYRLNSFFDDCINLFYIFKIFHKRNSLKISDDTGLNAMKVELIPGSFMFSSFKLFKHIGYFYPHTFLYSEERFIYAEVKKNKLNNYMILDMNYTHFSSSSINKSYNNLEKFKLLYDSWLKFTRVHRKYGKPKALFLSFLMKFSIIEIKLINKIKNLLRND